MESSAPWSNLQLAPLAQLGRLLGVQGDKVGVSRELGVVENLETCSSSLARRSKAKVRSLTDLLAPSSSSTMRCRARPRLEVRGEEGELKASLVSDVGNPD